MVQNKKVEKVGILKEKLKEYSSFIFVDYRGLNVQQINDLRNVLKEKGAHFHVVKNIFLKRAFNELGYGEFDRFLVNPTALAYFESDISEISKTLVDSTKETTLKLKGGYSNGTILTPVDIISISKLPSREALLALTVGLLGAPISGIVMVLSGILSKFIRTLKVIEESKNN